MARITAEQAKDPNIPPFLDLIGVSEGTSTIAGSDDGYNVLYGGGLFRSYLDHPRQKLTFKIKGVPVTSTAAGRYQLLSRYWDAYQASLRLTGGFTPINQDLVAIQQIRERRALQDIKAGRIEAAVAKCSNIWASFPGAGYNQHEHKIETLLAAFKNAGGEIAMVV